MKIATRTFLFLVLGVAWIGCGDDDGSTDAGEDQTVRDQMVRDRGGAPAPCEQDDVVCDDELFCNGVERCMPEMASADANGCVNGEAQCTGGLECDETTRSCVACLMDGPNDQDGDGFCSPGADCDDSDPSIHPDQPDVCLGPAHASATIDEDCDPTTVGERDTDGDGYRASYCCNGDTCGTDCEDGIRSVNPEASEVCDGSWVGADYQGRDDDCDGEIDEMLTMATRPDLDADGRAEESAAERAYCPSFAARSTSTGDCDDSNPNAREGFPEICDGVDNDCDGTIDEGTTEVRWYPDADNDGFGDAMGVPVFSCRILLGYALNDDDCDDTDGRVHPAATELCNGRDDNCDGYLIPGEDDDRDGWISPSCPGAPALVDCDDRDENAYPGATEVCDNGIDDDCDGTVDTDCAGAMDGGVDGGVDGGDSGVGALCRTNQDCEGAAGSLFCDGVQRCDPEDASADAFGCLAALFPSPCPGGEPACLALEARTTCILPNAPRPLSPFNVAHLGSTRAATGLSSPTNGRRPRFIWAPVTGAQRYEIELSTECMPGSFRECAGDGFATPLRDERHTITVASLAEIDHPIFDMPPGSDLPVPSVDPRVTRFYWHVRACYPGGGEHGCSSWSQTRMFVLGSAKDVNGDGYDDVLVGCSRYRQGVGASRGIVFARHGQSAPFSTGTMTGVKPFVSPSVAGFEWGYSLAAGDVDLDGYADVIVGGRGDSGFRGGIVFLRGGAAGLVPEDLGERWVSTALESRFGSSVVNVGDVDGDGVHDFVVGAWAEDSVRGAAYFFSGAQIGVASWANTVTPQRLVPSPRVIDGAYGRTSPLGDINGDGFADFVVHGDSVDVFLGGPFLTRRSVAGLSGDDLSTAGGDIDGDGFSDLLVWHSSETLSVYYGSLSPSLASPTTVLLPFHYNVRLADLNADGLLDIVAGNHVEGGGDVRIYVGTGMRETPFNLTPYRDFANPNIAGTGFGAISLGDFNGDGFVDVLGASLRNNGVGAVYLFPYDLSSDRMSLSHTTEFFGTPEPGWQILRFGHL